ncbi:MAG: hypothetical protein A2Z57_10770 [Planctomycetes bacterium RIFCSPHIGHO2_12_39_6]|nr:MAG: hypothetical protein A2Z57_10770 [Planctomycetes bacterium RIFCSPHIGHO2_12_39_6]
MDNAFRYAAKDKIIKPSTAKIASPCKRFAGLLRCVIFGCMIFSEKPGLRNETQHFMNVTMVGIVFRTPSTHYIIKWARSSVPLH